ncbi:hypothetical protein KKD62_03590 [Patescibacteria group bacterium]|nr:hypothetical protein [Patescibacteria group bacterium]MBU1931783.1 hypothetical protein [Patescibacteria group bacterium]
MIEQLTSIDIWKIVKIGYLIAILLYIVFTIIVARQVNLMDRAVNGRLNDLLKIISWAHFIIAILAGLLALIIL